MNLILDCRCFGLSERLLTDTLTSAPPHPPALQWFWPEHLKRHSCWMVLQSHLATGTHWTALPDRNNDQVKRQPMSTKCSKLFFAGTLGQFSDLFWSHSTRCDDCMFLGYPRSCAHDNSSCVLHQAACDKPTLGNVVSVIKTGPCHHRHLRLCWEEVIQATQPHKNFMFRLLFPFLTKRS